MRHALACLLILAIVVGCAHSAPTPPGCHVESGWLDASNGCSARAGYPDCYQVCPDGSRTPLQKLGQPQGQTRPPGQTSGAAPPASGSPGGAPADPQTGTH
jgi:hypothetical protein